MGNKDSIFVAGDSAGGNLTQYVVNQALNEVSRELGVKFYCILP